MGEPVRRLCVYNTLVQYAAYPAYILPFHTRLTVSFVMKELLDG
jgi:hypothetical protein